MKKLITLTTAVLVIAAGCAKKAEPVVQVEVPDVFVTAAPAGAPTPIAEARKAKPGEKVTITGLVMGNKRPIIEGRGAFIIGDPSKLTVCKLPEDGGHCKTIWDACCDAPAEKTASTVTIQVLGDDGKVLGYGLKGVKGLKELSKVTVSGTAAPTSSDQAFIINAEAIYVEP